MLFTKAARVRTPAQQENRVPGGAPSTRAGGRPPVMSTKAARVFHSREIYTPVRQSLPPAWTPACWQAGQTGLEGESARQGRSPQPSRWGGPLRASDLVPDDPFGDDRSRAYVCHSAPAGYMQGRAPAGIRTNAAAVHMLVTPAGSLKTPARERLKISPKTRTENARKTRCKGVSRSFHPGFRSSVNHFRSAAVIL